MPSDPSDPHAWHRSYTRVYSPFPAVQSGCEYVKAGRQCSALREQSVTPGDCWSSGDTSSVQFLFATGTKSDTRSSYPCCNQCGCVQVNCMCKPCVAAPVCKQSIDCALAEAWQALPTCGQPGRGMSGCSGSGLSWTRALHVKRYTLTTNVLCACLAWAVEGHLRKG